ncbi:MAG: LacI family transcriptional regulator [Burkholderiales bacterium]|nr:LacI family transcriptional regulator [Burkholderiales bacterium]
MIDWFTVLRARVDATSCQQVAEELGLSRTAVSLVLGGKYPASTARIATRVLRTYDRHLCPYLQEEIAGHECRRYAARKFSASAPMQARHWRACQVCPHNPFKRSDAPVVQEPVHEDA